jgi:histidinol phosphatase-like enzyme
MAPFGPSDLPRVPVAHRGNCLCGRWLVILEVYTVAAPLRCECGRRWRYGTAEAPVEIAPTLMPALCVDLDGTVRRSKSGAIWGPQSAEDVDLFPNVEAKLWEYRDRGFYVVGITNQGVVAYRTRTELEVEAITHATRAAFTRDPFHAIEACYALAAAQGASNPFWAVRSLRRKPGYGMLVTAEERARAADILLDWDHSIFVGDRPEDKGCAEAAGIAFKWAWDFFGRPAPTTEAA